MVFIAFLNNKNEILLWRYFGKPTSKLIKSIKRRIIIFGLLYFHVWITYRLSNLSSERYKILNKDDATNVRVYGDFKVKGLKVNDW
jgi:hypothetical protein